MQTFREYLESRQSGFPHQRRHSKDTNKRTHQEELDLQKKTSIFKDTQVGQFKVFVTQHQGQRTFDRRNDLTFQDWKKIHRRQSLALNGKESGNYMVFSKEYSQGYIIRQDLRRKELKVITVLPKGKKFPGEDTLELFVESFLEENTLIPLDLNQLELVEVQ